MTNDELKSILLLCALCLFRNFGVSFSDPWVGKRKNSYGIPRGLASQ